MNASEYMINFFTKKGIDTAFLVTGGHSMFLNDALTKQSPNFTIIPTHHEQTATLAASGYAKVAKKPAIAMVTAGPGATNALTGVVDAYVDSAPMIILSGQSATHFVDYQEKSNIRQYGTQGVYIKGMVTPFVKYFITLKHTHDLLKQLEDAYLAATTGRPGPVWIEVPLDIQRALLPDTFPTTYTMEQYEQKYNPSKDVELLIDLLSKAKRPIIMIGQGIHLSNSESELRRVIERLSIPVVASRMGIDVIEHSNPLYIGQTGSSGDRAGHFAIQNADLLITIGTRLASATIGHDTKDFARNAYKYVVDIDPEELNKPSIEIDHKVLCDAKVFLNNLIEKISTTSPCNFSSWAKLCESWKDKYPVVLEEYKNEGKVNSYYLSHCISQKASEKTVVITDGGSSFYTVHQSWKIKRGQRLITSCGISAMGGWSMSMGANLANKDGSTIVITGDGGLQMNIQEFATIKHHNLPIKIFIINNNGYLAIRNTQKNFMEGRLVGEGPTSGLWCPDALEIAKAYGIKGVRINNTSELDKKIQEVLDYNGPVICDVISPEWQVLQPKLASEKLPDGTMVSKPFEDLFPFIDRNELAEIMKISEDRSEIQK